MCLAKSYDQNKFFNQIMAISFVFWPNISASLRDPQICSDLHEFFFGVHSNIVEWDNPVAVNAQEPFANLSHPTAAPAMILVCNLYPSHVQSPGTR